MTTVTAGTSTTYTITVTNLGPSTVPAGVVVKDTIPADTTPSESEADCSISAGVLTCTTTAALAPAGSVSYSLTLAVASNYPGTSLANTASIFSSPVADGVPGNNTSTDTDTVAKSADLRITKTDAAATVTAGTSTTYTITVTNLGPSTVPAGVVVKDTIPADTTPSESEADCSISAGVLTCTTTAALAPAGSVSYSLTLAVASNFTNGGTLTNTASIFSSPVSDPNGANNSASDSDTVNRSADVADLKVESTDPVIAGTAMRYTITVTNAGPSDAEQVTLSDSLPAQFDASSAHVLHGHRRAPRARPGSGTLGLGDIVAGGSVSVTIQATVKANTPQGTVISNTATAVSPLTQRSQPRQQQLDRDDHGRHARPTSRSPRATASRASSPVTASCARTPSRSPTAVPSDAQAVSVADTWPAGFSRGTVTPSQGTCTGTPSFTCSLGTIAASAGATITVTYSVPVVDHRRPDQHGHGQHHDHRSEPRQRLGQ